MAIQTVEAQKRDPGGTRVARDLRRQGMVPGVFYIDGKETIPISCDSKKLSYLLSHAHGLLDLEISGETAVRKCVLKEVQYDPVSEEILHVDFLGVKMGEKIQLEVPLVLKGSPVGVKEGGIMEHIIRELEIECLPKDIPNFLEVDVSALDVGKSIQVRDLQFENITILDDPNETIVLVDYPKIVEPAVVEEGEEEEMAEPEVIGEEREDESEEE